MQSGGSEPQDWQRVVGTGRGMGKSQVRHIVRGDIVQGRCGAGVGLVHVQRDRWGVGGKADGGGRKRSGEGCGIQKVVRR